MRKFVYGCMIAFVLSACTGAGSGSDLRFGVQSAELAKATIDQIPARARMVSAQGQAIDDTAAVVTYDGPPNDFLACETREQDLQGKLSLDVRSTLAAEAAEIVISSFYVVTLERPAFEPVSISFDQSGMGTFPNGLRCQSTNNFEDALLGR